MNEMALYSLPVAVAAQFDAHVYDLRWRCGCVGKHGIEPGGCTGSGYRHIEPFHECPVCLLNLFTSGYDGPVAARTMREYAEVGR